MRLRRRMFCMFFEQIHFANSSFIRKKTEKNIFKKETHLYYQYISEKLILIDVYCVVAVLDVIYFKSDNI